MDMPFVTSFALGLAATVVGVLGWRTTAQKGFMDGLNARVTALSARVECLERNIDNLTEDKALLIESLQEHRDHIYRQKPPPPPPYPNIRK